MTPDEQRDWYRRSGHCAQCTLPGDFCQCSPAKPCGCAGPHTREISERLGCTSRTVQRRRTAA
jgi:hypothetical protein